MGEVEEWPGMCNVTIARKKKVEGLLDTTAIWHRINKQNFAFGKLIPLVRFHFSNSSVVSCYIPLPYLGTSRLTRCHVRQEAAL